MRKFSEKLIAWYKKNRRDLPWRRTSDPYKIWLSEIILQQTQVTQGLSYYYRFVEQYPSVGNLAKAPIDEVLKLWQGLGYYSRARNLHETAKYIVKHHKGIFPDSYSAIRNLKGIGDYTAAAITSIAYDLPYAVVDGNVYRVLSRVFHVELSIDTGEGKKYFQKLADQLLPPKKPADHNQAIMEFGALQCRPINPDCENCVMNSMCMAYSKKSVKHLPVKSKKTKVVNRYLNYVVFKQGSSVYIRKRVQKDIWQGLFEFYLIEKNKKESAVSVFKSEELSKTQLLKQTEIRTVSREYKHLLSHRRLYCRFYIVELKNSIRIKGLKRVSLKSINTYPFPRLIERYINHSLTV